MTTDLRRDATEPGGRTVDHSADFDRPERIASAFVPIGLRLLSLARPNSDDIHIDLATGAGLIPALADARRMMTCIPPWRVAMDDSAAMLRRARAAARSTHLVQGGLAHLPFRSGSIDLLTLSLGISHPATPQPSLPELRRVLSRRGRLVLATFGEERNPVWRAFDDWWEGAGVRRPPSARASHHPLPSPDSLRSALLEVGGLSSVDVIAERSPMPFQTFGAFWAWRIEFPDVATAITACSSDRQAQLRKACRRALAAHLTDGGISADRTVLYAVARR